MTSSEWLNYYRATYGCSRKGYWAYRNVFFANTWLMVTFSDIIHIIIVQ